jgi:chorismate dehydratase
MDQPAVTALRLGKIEFLNVLPIYYPLEAGIVEHSFRIVSGTPAQLNVLMANGELDLSNVSSIEYARHPERYLLVPDISVSSCGAVKSVLLLSRVPLPELRRANIMVSRESATSMALLRMLLAMRYGIPAHYQSGNVSQALAGDQSPTAVLVIGDEALRLKNHPDYPYRWDLGALWHEWTGLPFVFGLWVVQRAALELRNGDVGPAVQRLLEAKAWGCDHLAEIAQHGTRRGLLSHDELYAYYRNFSYHLREAELSGLTAFYRYLAEIGEIPAVPSLECYSPMASVA